MIIIKILERPNVNFLNTYYHELKTWLGEQERLSIEKSLKHYDKIDKLLGWILCKTEAAEHFNIKPQTIKIAYQKYGKPFFLDFPEYRFNLSHGGNLIVAAFSDQAEVGIDVESCNRKVDVEIAKRFFTISESDFINKLPNNKKEEYFLRVWTVKEAYLKMWGTGLYKALNSFEVQFSEEKINIIENNQLQQITTKQYITENKQIITICTMPTENNFNFYYKTIETIINFVEKNRK